MPNGSSRAGYLKLMARSLAMRRYEGAWISSFWALGLFCLLLLAWQAAVLALAIPEIILPSPTAIADYLIRRNELFLRTYLADPDTNRSWLRTGGPGGYSACDSRFTHGNRQARDHAAAGDRADRPEDRGRAVTHALVRSGRSVARNDRLPYCGLSDRDQYRFWPRQHQPRNRASGPRVCTQPLGVLLEDPTAACAALHLRWDEGVHYLGHLWRDCRRVRVIAERSRLSDHFRQWPARHCHDDDFDHRSQRRRARALRGDRPGGAGRGLLWDGQRGVMRPCRSISRAFTDDCVPRSAAVERSGRTGSNRRCC